MLRTRLTIAVMTLLALGILGAGTGLLAFRAGAQGPAEPNQRSAVAEARQAPDPEICALLLIEEREPQVLPDVQRPTAGGGDAAAFRRTQVVLLQSRPVLRAALRMKGVADLAVVKNQADPAVWLEENLLVALIDNTGVVRVIVTRGSAAERAALANAIADAYLEEVVGEEVRRKQVRLNHLEKIRNEYEAVLKEKRQRLQKLAQVLGSARPLRQAFDREDLSAFRKELQRVRLARVAAQARLNYLKKAGAKEAVKDTVTKLEEEVAVLAEQEKLLKAEIAPLADAAENLASHEAVENTELTSAREEIAAAEQITRRVAHEVAVMEVENQATPRVRLIQRAEVPRPGK